ncbi:MAG TPA: ribonuclease Y [Nitrospina sp.]|jgi:ribonuclease Y|nr:ribonuclease Y [Nitrospina sp.]|tara:strand:- start:4882 stop:6501 length:1620 start_codon:yes stop_codon:yes gene_type:complete
MHIFTAVKFNLSTLLIGMFLAVVIGYFIGYFLRKLISQYQIKEAEAKKIIIVEEAEHEAQNRLKAAAHEAQNRLKAAAVEAREQALVTKTKIEKEVQGKWEEVREQERTTRKKEDELRLSFEKTRDLEKELARKMEAAEKSRQSSQDEQARYDELVKQEMVKLENISSFTAEEAKEEIKRKVIDVARLDAAKEVKRIEEFAKNNADEEARKIITMAVQRLASDSVAESTISVVELPDDSIKGRIIGREGRNIRALEQATGIDLIIDDTPGAVVLSGFDPIRREVARRALEKLTLDGRIHPGRIEDVVNKCRREVEQQIKQAGEQAVVELEMDNVNPELAHMLGRLKYRTSYTQNVLEHVKEVAKVCGFMAAELGLDVQLAKRAGLLHDIGKSIDRQTDGTHTQLGVDVANRFNEHKYVVNAIAAHHEDVEPESVYAVLVIAGDTISASRPGARREMLETYVKRMTKLEEIGDSFKGVEKTYAIQAGREVRIIVVPDGTSDTEANMLAKDVAKRIEKEVTYPGEIKITVVRETRFVEVAR